jgi:hypothetical protein
MAPEMRTTSLADADSQVNRTKSDGKGSSIVVDLTADNYPEGATMQPPTARPSSAIPASNRSKTSVTSPPTMRRKVESK